MAVSKTQNERPAIVALIDAVNATEPIVAQNVQDIATLTDNLGDEIANRENADANIQNQIGEGFSSELTIAQSLNATNSAVDDINTWQDLFRMGLTSSITVAANSTTSSTVSFETPFADNAEVAVFPACVGASATFTNLSCKLISANYLGFSFSVVNNSEEAATIKVGYLAVRMN